MKRCERASRAFTIVEVAVIVGIMALLALAMIPALQESREAARRAQCQCLLGQLAFALNAYHEAWNVFPPGYSSEARARSDGSGTFEVGPGWGWGATILDRLEASSTYNAINFHCSIVAAESLTARTATLGFLLCPSETRTGPASFHATVAGVPSDLGPSSYVANGGTAAEPSPAADGGNGVFGRDVSWSVRDVIDGAKYTILLGERSRELADASWAGVVPDAVHATSPTWPVRSSGHACATVLGFVDPFAATSPSPREVNSMQAGHAAFRGPHPRGANFAMVDGSVKFLKDSTYPGELRAQATRAGGEVFMCDCPYEEDEPPHASAAAAGEGTSPSSSP